jgi:hypothetical protein
MASITSASMANNISMPALSIPEDKQMAIRNEATFEMITDATKQSD